METRPSKISVYSKKVVWVLFWIIVSSFVLRAVYYYYNPYSDITLFRLDNGEPVGLVTVVFGIGFVVIMRFLYMGVVFYKNRHYGLLINEGAINRDLLIYRLQRELNLADLIEREIPGLQPFSDQIKIISNIVKRNYLYKEQELGYVEYMTVKRWEEIERDKLESIKARGKYIETSRPLYFYSPQDDWGYSKYISWIDRYLNSGLKDKVIEVANQRSHDSPGEYENSIFFDPYMYNPDNLESGLCVRHKSGADLTIRVKPPGVTLRLGYAIGSKVSNEDSVIIPEEATTEDIIEWFNKIIRPG